jgi:hypothetical protein
MFFNYEISCICIIRMCNLIDVYIYYPGPALDRCQRCGRTRPPGNRGPPPNIHVYIYIYVGRSLYRDYSLKAKAHQPMLPARYSPKEKVFLSWMPPPAAVWPSRGSFVAFSWKPRRLVCSRVTRFSDRNRRIQARSPSRLALAQAQLHPGFQEPGNACLLGCHFVQRPPLVRHFVTFSSQSQGWKLKPVPKSYYPS